MRRLSLAVAALILGLAAGTAWAGNGFYFQPNYSYYPARPYYPPPVAIYQAPVPFYGSSGQYSEGERRIMAAHSRYRYYTHPRSQYNSPPNIWWDSYGW